MKDNTVTVERSGTLTLTSLQLDVVKIMDLALEQNLTVPLAKLPMQVDGILNPAVFVLAGPQDVINAVADDIESGKLSVSLDK